MVYFKMKYFDWLMKYCQEKGINFEQQQNVLIVFSHHNQPSTNIYYGHQKKKKKLNRLRKGIFLVFTVSLKVFEI